MLSAYLGDHYHVRGPILVVNSLIALIGTSNSLLFHPPPLSSVSYPRPHSNPSGLPLMGFASTPAARYFGVFLVTAGTNANIPTALAYQANNVRGQWKRALCSAMFVAFGGMGGISGGTIFRSQDAPRYLPGIGAAIASVLVLFIPSESSIHFISFIHPVIVLRSAGGRGLSIDARDQEEKVS